jgi:hypothetical protein
MQEKNHPLPGILKCPGMKKALKPPEAFLGLGGKDHDHVSPFHAGSLFDHH